MTKQLEAALRLTEKGFHIFPIKPGTKDQPYLKDYPNKAFRDKETVEKWFGNGKQYNIGISTTKFMEDESLIVVDVDNKGTKKGDESLLELEFSGLDFPNTAEQTTPTGGRHLIYRADMPYKQGVNVLGSGLDIRSKGGYIVGAGSTLPNGTYTLIDREIAPAPNWLKEKLKKAKENVQAIKRIEGINEDMAVKRASYYLKNEAPISVKGEGGDQTAYKVAAAVKDFGVDQMKCLELMMTDWHNGCGWTAEKLNLKVQHAYRYGQEPIGTAAPEAVFKSLPLEKDVPGEEKEFYLDEINKTYALIFMEGTHFILHETVDQKGKPKRVFLTEASFKRRFSPFSVQSGKGRPLTYADVWLDWKGRREYDGVCFAPEREARNNYYNLWKGFTCKPTPPESATEKQKLGLSMYLDHAKENVCGGDEKLFEWLMGYFAHMIQKPYERPLTTIVFRGKKGTGKNVLVDRVGRLLGREHYLVAQNSRYLTSNFNGHMDSCLMLVLDEAFWSGDKSAEGQLKGITTSPEIMIERKGKEPYMVDNLVRLVVIGNEKWLVPASADERRYAVFQMGDKRKQDRAFFSKMTHLLDNEGGCELLLHYFKTFDLSKVDVNDAPKTEALLEQKLDSADPIEQWWHECLIEGRLVNCEFTSEWNTKVDKEILREAFKNYLKDRNIRTGWIPNNVSIGIRLKNMCSSVVADQQRRHENRFIKEYRLPELDQARKEWEAYIGHEVKWL